MGTLILVRHATTDASATGRNLGQRSDSPLSGAGRELAAKLGSTLAFELGELPHDEMRLVSSPALRCRETAAAIAAGIDMAADGIEVVDGLIEIDYGSWEGLTAEESTAADPALRARWDADPFATAAPGGESGADVARRAFAAFEPIETWLAADRARCAIVVAHNHVNRLRLCALFGWPMRDYRRRVVTDPGGYSIVTIGADVPVIRRVNAAP